MPSSTGISHQQVYVILGAAGSGRLEIIADLISSGLDANHGERAHIYLPDACFDASSATIPSGISVGILQWDAQLNILRADSPPHDVTHVFLLTDGMQNPVDQLEAIKLWITTHKLVLARIITVIDCQLAEATPPLRIWFDACIHFSDVVLLNKRDGVANKWISEFRRHYEETQCMPCMFEVIKSGKVRNPANTLDTTTRRLSQYFDTTEWDSLDLGDVEIEEYESGAGEMHRGLVPNYPIPDGQPVTDPFLERRENGCRKILLPNISKFIRS